MPRLVEGAFTTPAPTASMPLTLDAVFRAYAPYVAAIGLRLLSRNDDVDDLVQEVFLRAVEGLRDRSEPAAVKGWLATVTVRVARRKLYFRRWKQWLGLDEAIAREPMGTRAADPEQRAAVMRAAAMLDTLPVQDRVAWVLRNVEGASLDEVAQSCGCSLATAKRRIASAQRRIDKAVSHGG